MSRYMDEDQISPFVILPLRKEDTIPIDCYVEHIRTYAPAKYQKLPDANDEDKIRLYSVTDGLLAGHLSNC